MSYFLFGYANASFEDFSDLDCKIHVQSKCPDVVIQMLEEQGRGIVKGHFLVCGKDQEDTSDSIISPFQVSKGHIIGNLRNIQNCIYEISKTSNIIRIYITEGYDDKFETAQIVCGNLADELAARLEREGDWPSLAVEVLSGNGDAH